MLVQKLVLHLPITQQIITVFSNASCSTLCGFPISGVFGNYAITVVIDVI